MHPFDTATRLEPLPDRSVRGHASPACANMVGPFVGVTAACSLQAPMQQPPRLLDPVARNANFAASLAARRGVRVDLSQRLLRAERRGLER